MAKTLVNVVVVLLDGTRVVYQASQPNLTPYGVMVPAYDGEATTLYPWHRIERVTTAAL